MALDRISNDFAVLKSNSTFSGSFAISGGTVTLSYGDGTSEVSNVPSHTYSSTPPYIINMKDVDEDLITGISISGSNVTAVDVSRFKNVTNLNTSGNLLPFAQVNQMLIDLDESGQLNGTIDLRGNAYNEIDLGTDLSAEGIVAYNSLVTKGWSMNSLVPWTPSEVTTSLWLDASDDSTIWQQDTVGSVSTWDDKSGNGRHVEQTTGSSQPSTGTRTLNGLNVLDFQGNVDSLQNLSLNLPVSGNGLDGSIMVMGVYELDTSTNVNDGLFGLISNSRGSFDIRTLGGGFGCSLVLQDNDQGWNQYNNFADGPHAGPSIYCGEADASNSLFNGYVDGQIHRTLAYTGTRYALFNSLRIMRKSDGAQGVDEGACGEFIILTDVSTETRQKVEGYLAHKWGLTANLPSDHPYKTLPPSKISPWTPTQITTSAWFDATDASTIWQQDTVGFVSQWDDKSGNNKHASQGVGTKQPTSGTQAINGLNALDFDGIDDYLETLAFLDTQDDWAIFAVSEFEGDDDIVLGFTGGGHLFRTSPTNSRMFFFPIGTRTLFDEAMTSTPRLYEATFDTSGSGTVTGYVDGNLGTTSNPYSINTSTNATATIGIHSNKIINAWDGRIGELIFIKDITEDTRQKIEGYLAHKWGLTANLPPSHPSLLYRWTYIWL